jgi:D-sedoheptulose 7-phosphate isomerase
VNNLEKLFQDSPSSTHFAKGYLNYLSEVLGRLDHSAIAAFIDVLLEAREKGSRIFFIGNGGSAATASHFANDIGIGTRTLEKPFRALSLGDNNAVVTAIANDFGYEEVFVQQLKTLMLSGDVVVAISASGNSPNVIKAIEFANTHGAKTVGLTGFDGGKLRSMVSINLHVPSEKGEYGPVEDVHMIFDHLVGAYLGLLIKKQAQKTHL